MTKTAKREKQQNKIIIVNMLTNLNNDIILKVR